MTTDVADIATIDQDQQDTTGIIEGGIIPMERLLKEHDVPLKIYKEGDAVDTVVEKVSKRKISVSIDGRINGIVGGREILFDAQVIKGIKKGDKMTAYVILR